MSKIDIEPNIRLINYITMVTKISAIYGKAPDIAQQFEIGMIQKLLEETKSDLRLFDAAFNVIQPVTSTSIMQLERRPPQRIGIKDVWQTLPTSWHDHILMMRRQAFTTIEFIEDRISMLSNKIEMKSKETQ